MRRVSLESEIMSVCRAQAGGRRRWMSEGMERDIPLHIRGTKSGSGSRIFKRVQIQLVYKCQWAGLPQ